MELNINVITSNTCKVIIQDKSEYLPEDNTGIAKYKFKSSDTISIGVLLHNKSTESVYLNPVYSKDNITEIPVTFDGWFTVNYLVLPSEEWFLKSYYNNQLDIYNIVYFTDGNSIYKYIPSENNIYTVSKVDIEEVLEINPINTTISKISKDYVSICFLRKCYINLCLQIFNQRGFSSCWNKNDIDSDLIYRRDLVWMALNVIKYLTECEQLAEVERILEIIEGCNGLCTSSNITSKTNGCGCSK